MVDEENGASERPSTIEIMGVRVDVVTLAEAVLKTVSLWERNGCHHVVTVNPELLMTVLEDPENGELLRAVLEGTALTVADGIGVVWASRIQGTPLPERVPGIELAEGTLAAAAAAGKRVYLLGGRPGVAAEAGLRLQARFAGLEFAGTAHGYFEAAEERDVVERIAAIRPDLLLVGLGAPKQELWIARHRDRLHARVVIGIGGALDVFAGHVRRAPLTLQRLGLEWAYRLAKEPARARRMTALPRFVAAVLWRQWQRRG